jgi:hypothetical protein
MRFILGRLAIFTFLMIPLASGMTAAQETKKKDKTPTAAQLKIADAISNGHSYQKHVVDEELFPEVKSKADFAKVIAGVLANPSHHKDLANEREAYYDQATNIIVIVNPHAKDRGTCFRPSGKKRYYDNLK